MPRSDESIYHEKAEGHKPTAEMARVAKRALEWRDEYGRGGTDVGVARARDISNRENLSTDTVNRMVSFFARHGANREDHYNEKESDGGPSAWRIAWDLWGGDPGRTWANNTADEDEKGSGMSIEHKSVPFEVKEVDPDGRITGYGAVFGNVDQGNDVIMPDAFNGCITRALEKGYKPKMLWQHDPSQPIGVWDMMKADERGLLMQGRVIADVAKGREAIALLKAKAVDGLSIGYKTTDCEYEENDLGMIRKIKAADVWETSIVTFPMNPEATVTDVKQLQSPREVERLLRKQGVPGNFAKLLSLHGFEGAMERLRKDSSDGDEAKAQTEAIDGLIQKLRGLKETFNA